MTSSYFLRRSRRRECLLTTPGQVELLETRAVLASEWGDLDVPNVAGGSASREMLPPTPPQALSDVAAVKVTSGFILPVFATSAPGELNNLYVLELHSGQIRVVDLLTNTIRPTPFLTVTGISTGGERGLLGLAFAPDYETSGLFYVNYTNASSRIQVDQFRRDAANPSVADPASRTTILATTGTQTNHFGGWIGFGPDGFLYVATGDAGGANDVGAGHNPDIGNAQDITDNLFGKVLRLDVGADAFPNDPDRNYSIPASNPFVGIDGDDEIWVYGLRNPFRNGFDRLTGDLVIGDVGQGALEEVDFLPAGAKGLNFGWAAREGTIATPSSPLGGPKPAGAIDPVYEYTHGNGANQGQSITGGYVYRGPITELNGRYFFGDFIKARMWSINISNASDPTTHDGTNFTDFVDWTTSFNPPGESGGFVATFGEDLAGNLYFADWGKGNLFRVTGPTAAKKMQRTFNPNANFHFFTSSQAETQAVIDSGYRDENSAPVFSVLEKIDIGAAPVHRLYNPVLGTHYLTISSPERDYLVQQGLIYERDEGFLYTTQRPGTVEVFRLYNRDSGTHLFTNSTAERDQILTLFPGSWELHTSLGFAPAPVVTPPPIPPASAPAAPQAPTPTLSGPVSTTPEPATSGDTGANVLTDTRIALTPTDARPVSQPAPYTETAVNLLSSSAPPPALPAVAREPIAPHDLEQLDTAFRILPNIWDQPA